jgi:2,3-bisphosphoglycerate-independent phosphoglycerate mutase
MKDGTMKDKKLMLIILDGWGQGDRSGKDAVWNADTPFMKSLCNNPDWAHALLDCSGETVGLPAGQMGNSEVGHLNIGGGRIVYQDLVKINLAIRDGSINNNKVFLDAFDYAGRENKTVHFVGLIGDGGVHATSEHLLALCDMAQESGLEHVFIHAITDGRDTDPKSGLKFLEEIELHIRPLNVRIASVCGRYFTMDRDKRWERVRKGYDLMVHGVGTTYRDAGEAIRHSYEMGVTDEFIEPVVITDNDDVPLALIREGDVVICFNFRTDRLREITMALSQQDMPEHGMKTMPLHFVTMTRYDESFNNVRIAFDKDDLAMTLGEVLSLNGIKQIRIAETEKYPHVTFFFNGGRETPFDGEKRILVQSPKVATYDLKPEMSAGEVKDAIIPELKHAEAGFICLNFANADMVGHTGVYDAIVRALETVDSCVEEIVATAQKSGYSMIITADHGNADVALNDDGSPNTAHSMNPVPVFLHDSDCDSLRNGKLADIAPTILTILGLDIPPEMTGEVLIARRD